MCIDIVASLVVSHVLNEEQCLSIHGRIVGSISCGIDTVASLI
ncbi:6426_t:CDS:2 [Entrophospora sp. SA101]|nr:6426_t:CDS:2 [Entrophospora sp. SA101]